MKIITNNKPRPLLSIAELPAKVAEEFDYIGEDERYDERIFCYKGEYYDALDMVRAPGKEAPAETREAFKGWDAYASDSFFSGIVIRLPGDDSYFDGAVIVGRYCC